MILFLHPIYTLNTWHFAKMLGVVGDHSQTIVTGGYCYENVKVSNNQPLASQRMTIEILFSSV